MNDYESGRLKRMQYVAQEMYEWLKAMLPVLSRKDYYTREIEKLLLYIDGYGLADDD